MDAAHIVGIVVASIVAGLVVFLFLDATQIKQRNRLREEADRKYEQALEQVRSANREAKR